VHHHDSYFTALYQLSENERQAAVSQYFEDGFIQVFDSLSH
jgi:hypothetical protein